MGEARGFSDDFCFLCFLNIKLTPKDKNGIADSEARNTLNFSDNFGQTPLHRACIDSNYDDVYELLHNSKVVVEVNATDYIGRTPLHYACEAGPPNKITASLTEVTS
uniref:Uncharacterized protein n=1 Tax=Amphimedon queenslandica TaxID=400682 RepID=A0A1X7UDH7_AMPQE